MNQTKVYADIFTYCKDNGLYYYHPTDILETTATVINIQIPKVANILSITIRDNINKNHCHIFARVLHHLNGQDEHSFITRPSLKCNLSCCWEFYQDGGFSTWLGSVVAEMHQYSAEHKGTFRYFDEGIYCGSMGVFDKRADYYVERLCPMTFDDVYAYTVRTGNNIGDKVTHISTLPYRLEEGTFEHEAMQACMKNALHFMDMATDK